MKRTIILIICALLMCQFSMTEAQSKKRSSKGVKQTTSVQKKKKKKTKGKTRNQDGLNEQSSTVTMSPETTPITTEQEQAIVFSDPLIIENVIEGYSIGNKIYLTANEHYLQLTENQRCNLVSKFLIDNKDCDVIVMVSNDEQEWWSNVAGTPQRLEHWATSSMDLEQFAPLELQTRGENRVFYSVGGLLNYCDNTLNTTLMLQGGTYLYKNLLDLSVALNLGYNKAKDSDGQFIGDVAISTRVYLPLHLDALHLAPYVGGGVGWTFSPSSTVEPRALAGICWFVGPGSLDLGAQWGKNSKFSFMFGYTFRPRFGK